MDDLTWRSPRNGATHTTAQLREQKAEVVMERGVKVSGSLTGPDGRPVPRALVIWGDDPYNNSTPQEVWADERGRYTLPPLSPGPTLLTVVAGGFAPELQMMNLAASEPENEENVPLRAGKTITFQIVDGAGKPVPKARGNIGGWRGKKSLFNWRHSNVPYSKISDLADDQGVHTWTWAPEDAVEFNFGKKGFEYGDAVPYETGTHTVTMYAKGK